VQVLRQVPRHPGRDLHKRSWIEPPALVLSGSFASLRAELMPIREGRLAQPE
jgi:hypothetical protein